MHLVLCIVFCACGSIGDTTWFLWFYACGSICDVLCVLCVMFLVVVLAFDLDATGLEGEEAPSSPKASPSTLSSTLGREKRIPFFKKVTTPSKPRPQRPLQPIRCLSAQPHGQSQATAHRLAPCSFLPHLPGGLVSLTC